MGVIVVATDGSVSAGLALRKAIDLARETHDTIAVITVWQALQGDFGIVFPPGAPLESLLDQERRHAEDTLAQAVGLVEAAGLTARARLAAGDPASVICGYADEVDARLIAMGTHGHSTVMKLLVGSVSAEVVRHAERPVLIVPTGSVKPRERDRQAAAAG